MRILSRGRLNALITNNSVETNLIDFTDTKRTNHTIIHVKKDGVDKFHRVVWGEIQKNDDEWILWYEQTAEEVTIESETGEWMTKDERKAHKNNRTLEDIFNVDLSRYSISKEDDGLIFINGIKAINDPNGFHIVGGYTGQGKTEYAVREVIKGLKDDKSILYFSTDMKFQEVMRRLVRAAEPNIYSNYENGTADKDDLLTLNATFNFLMDSKLIIDDNYLIDSNYIIDKMEKVATNDGLDLVVIDYLKLSPTRDSHNRVIRIHELIDDYRQKLGCKVLITTQLNGN